VPIVAVIILAVILIRAMSSETEPPPAITKDCRDAAFTLSTYSSEEHKPVRWSMTGTPGTVYELTLGVDHFRVEPDGTLHAVPANGGTSDDAQRASPQLTMDSDCLRDGTFGVVVPPGSYVMKMYELSGTTDKPQATEVARHEFTVTAPP
jgi:hypothetical protein